MNSEILQPEKIDANKFISDKPLVSIITPVLNRVKYVEECILNILNQTYPNIEHIIVDGGSTDGTMEILAAHQAKNTDRIRYISEPDDGLGDAVNKGWKMAKGEILGWIDVGDTYKPDAVAAIVEGFKSSGADIVFGGGDMINAKGEFLRTYITNDFNLKETIRDRNQMHTPPSAFYRREVIKELGWVTPNSGETIELHIAAGKKYKIHRIDKLIFTIRLQADSITYSKNGRGLVRESFRTGYVICRKYGGGMFAPRCRRYYIFQVLDKLRIYDFVVLVVLVRLRRYSFVNKFLSKLGLLTN
ncbi:MAG: glycosyltransferase family 2 protein [Dehalococcoidales bacterium]|nr:glycosyltransferase family 2 protein [Dehalococcoidales bacterium]